MAAGIAVSSGAVQHSNRGTGGARRPLLHEAPAATQFGPVSLPATTHSSLARSMDSLQEAIATSDVPTRYARAHVAALRAAAALLAARAQPALTRRRQRSAWVLLSEVAPELSEWATFFAAGASKRAAAEAGSTRAVSDREADDLVRDADRFLAVVESALGLVPHPPIDAYQAALVHMHPLAGRIGVS